jgi:hypothetical protein
MLRDACSPVPYSKVNEIRSALVEQRFDPFDVWTNPNYAIPDAMFLHKQDAPGICSPQCGCQAIRKWIGLKDDGRGGFITVGA